MDFELTDREFSVVTAWASSVFTAWLLANPTADIEARRKEFIDCVEGGKYLVLENRELW